MNFTEQVIDGVLCWKGSPQGEWTPYTAKELTDRLLRVLGLVQAFIEAWDHDGEPDAMSYEVAVDQARKYRASLPAQRAQGGAGKHACDLPGCVSCDNPPDSEMVDSVKDRELDHGRDDWKA